jgi:hypothetical protein
MATDLLELIGMKEFSGMESIPKKQCTRCKEIRFPIEEYFYIRTTGKVDTICKVCIREKDGSYFVDKKQLLDGTSPLIEEGEKWAVAVRYGQELSGYLVSSHGRVVGNQNQFLVPSIGEQPSLQYPQYKLYYDEESLGGYSHSKQRESGYKGKARRRANIKAHRLVAETFMPIDKNPPIPLEDWNQCPESAKQWIRETALIDHIDDNKKNPHLDNLRWTTPLKNHIMRKAKENEE